MKLPRFLPQFLQPGNQSIAQRGWLRGKLHGKLAGVLGGVTFVLLVVMIATQRDDQRQQAEIESHQLQSTAFQTQDRPGSSHDPSQLDHSQLSDSRPQRTIANPFVASPQLPAVNHRFRPATQTPQSEKLQSEMHHPEGRRPAGELQPRQIGNPFAREMRVTAGRDEPDSRLAPVGRFDRLDDVSPQFSSANSRDWQQRESIETLDADSQVSQVSQVESDPQLPALIPPVGLDVGSNQLQASVDSTIGESRAAQGPHRVMPKSVTEERATEERVAANYGSFVLPNLPPVGSSRKKVPAKLAAAPLTKQDDQPGDLAGTLGSTKYLLAEQPKAEDEYHDRPPLMSDNAFVVPYSADDFGADPQPTTCYDPYAQQEVYQGKSLYANQRPLVELGKPWYQMGQIAPAKLWFGRHNPVSPQFLVYGDFRTGFASNVNNGNQQSVMAMRLNLDFDFRLTSTERFHWFMGPLDRGANFTRVVHDAGETHFISEFDPDIDFGYFEGDMGAIWGGLANKTLPFDMPFAMGVMPLLFQNGVWLEDEFLGWAATIPARNSPALDISNMDVTFFAGYDKVTSPAFAGDDHDAKIYGMASFIEAAGGYIELDYAFLEDRSPLDRSYHNSSVSYTRRYGRFVSNSIRLINNAGQSPNGIDQTADGTVLLFENSLVSGSPLSFVPYLNGFVGFDRPQSAARAAASGGVLRNTGILFETDGLTGYPTLDATANNTFGGAMGLNIIAKDFSQQLILEAAMVQPFEGVTSNANGEQYGFGMRYQLPLSNSVILRCDSMYGLNASDDDVQGYRVELRKKW